PRRNRSLPERRGSAQDTFVVGGDLRDGFLLERPKLPPELRFNRRARVSFVPNFGPDLVRLEKRQGLRQASTRHSDVLGKFLAACDHTRLVVRRESHRLSLVELGVLKCRQPEQSIQHGRWQILLFHVNEVRANDLNSFWQRPFDRFFLPFARRRQGPRVLNSLLVGAAPPNAD